MKKYLLLITLVTILLNGFSQELSEKETSVGGHYSLARHNGFVKNNYHGIGMFMELKGHEKVSNYFTVDVYLPVSDEFDINVYSSYDRIAQKEKATLNSTFLNFSAGYRYLPFVNNKTLDGLLKGISFELNYGLSLKHNDLLVNEKEVDYGSNSNLEHFRNKIKGSFIYGLGIGYEYPLEAFTPYIQLFRRASFAKFGGDDAVNDDYVFFNNAIIFNLGVKIAWQ